MIYVGRGVGDRVARASRVLVAASRGDGLRARVIRPSKVRELEDAFASTRAACATRTAR